MSAKSHYFKLGLFILVGFFLLTGAVTILGLGFFAEDNIVMETYLNESVQGLDIGSPVKFMGVKVGNIKTIGFTYNKYQEQTGLRHRYVLIEMQVDPRLTVGKGDAKERKLILAQEIDHGLRIKIAPQGITGTAFLEIDYVDPKRDKPLPIDWEPEYYYIPSTPGTISRLEEILENAGKTLHKFANIDFEAIFKDIDRLIVSLNLAVHDANIAELSKTLLSLLQRLQDTNNKIQTALDEKTLKLILTRLQETLDHLSAGTADLPATMAQAQRMIREVTTLINSQRDQIQALLQNGRQMMQNFNELSGDAKRNPSRLILGAPPAPAPTPKDTKK